MKKILFVLFVLSGFMFGQVDHNPKYITSSIDSGATYLDINLYNEFGTNVGEWYKIVGFFTPNALTTDSIYVQGYDVQQDTFRTVESEAGAGYLLKVEANKYYPLNKDYMRGLSRIRLSFTDIEAAARSFTIVGKVED